MNSQDGSLRSMQKLALSITLPLLMKKIKRCLFLFYFIPTHKEKQRNGCWFSVPARLRKYWWINCCSVAFHKAPAVTSCSWMQNDKCIYKFEKFNFVYNLWLLAFCILGTQTIHVFFIDTGTVYLALTTYIQDYSTVPKLMRTLISFSCLSRR